MACDMIWHLALFLLMACLLPNAHGCYMDYDNWKDTPFLRCHVYSNISMFVLDRMTDLRNQQAKADELAVALSQVANGGSDNPELLSQLASIANSTFLLAQYRTSLTSHHKAKQTSLYGTAFFWPYAKECRENHTKEMSEICDGFIGSFRKLEAICRDSTLPAFDGWVDVCESIVADVRSIKASECNHTHFSEHSCTTYDEHPAVTTSVVKTLFDWRMLKRTQVFVHAFLALAELRNAGSNGNNPYVQVISAIRTICFDTRFGIQYSWAHERSIRTDVSNKVVRCTNRTATSNFLDNFIQTNAEAVQAGVAALKRVCEHYMLRYVSNITLNSTVAASASSISSDVCASQPASSVACICEAVRNLSSSMKAMLAAYPGKRDRALAECPEAVLPLELQRQWKSASPTVLSYFVELATFTGRTVAETAGGKLVFMPSIIFRLLPPRALQAEALISLTIIHQSVYPYACVQQQKLRLHVVKLDDSTFLAQSSQRLLVNNSAVYLFRIAKISTAKPSLNISNELCRLMIDFAETKAAKQGAIFLGESSEEFYAARLLNRFFSDIIFNPDTPDIAKTSDFAMGTSYQAYCRAFANPRPRLRWFLRGVEIPEQVLSADDVPIAIVPEIIGISPQDINEMVDTFLESGDTGSVNLDESNCTFSSAGVTPTLLKGMRPKNCRKDLFEPNFDPDQVEYFVFESRRCGKWWTMREPILLQPQNSCEPLIVLYGKSPQARKAVEPIYNYRVWNGSYETLSGITFNSSSDLGELVCCAQTNRRTYCKQMHFEVSNPAVITPNVTRLYENDSISLVCANPGAIPKVQLPAQSISYLKLTFSSAKVFSWFDQHVEDAAARRCSPLSDTLLSWQVSTSSSSDLVPLGDRLSSAIAESELVFENANYAVKHAGGAENGGLLLFIKNVSESRWRDAVFTCSARPTCVCRSDRTTQFDILDYSQCGHERVFKVPAYATFTLTVNPVIPPHFAVKQTKHLFVDRYGGNVTIDCDPLGDPTPQITWLRNGAPIEEAALAYSQSSDKRQLTIFDVSPSLLGAYTCSADGGRGRVESAQFQVEIAEDPNVRKLLVPGAATAATIIVVALMLALLISEYRRRRNMLKGLVRLLNAKGVHFKPTDSPADLLRNLSYDEDALELPKSQLEFSRLIGEGNYGAVYAGIRYAGKLKDQTQVAIKTTKFFCSDEHYYALLAELKIMSTIGDHPNLLRLIGAVTRNLIKGEIYLVLELCQCSLHAFLHEQRKNLTESYSTLIKICLGVSTGMEFLGQRNVVHRDLAARNVLITDDRVAKIADYGMSKILKASGTYKISRDHFYSAWTSPELALDKIASPRSDVWSFGVLLWEVFTLGDEPFENCYRISNKGVIFDGEQYLRLVRSSQGGACLTRPAMAGDDVSELILNCTAYDPARRPTFAECTRVLDAALSAAINRESKEELAEDETRV